MLESDMNERLRNRLVTVHGLDFGIPAEMTAFFRLGWSCV